MSEQARQEWDNEKREARERLRKCRSKLREFNEDQFKVARGQHTKALTNFFELERRQAEGWHRQTTENRQELHSLEKRIADLKMHASVYRQNILITRDSSQKSSEQAQLLSLIKRDSVCVQKKLERLASIVKKKEHKLLLLIQLVIDKLKSICNCLLLDVKKLKDISNETRKQKICQQVDDLVMDVFDQLEILHTECETHECECETIGSEGDSYPEMKTVIGVSWREVLKLLNSI
ncbi:unnamed protein product [Caenorhabditis sp. 36 PRJEB53466]|nr:unnamed protein product [Caenorhabditis sp. 36 PRJEB53466]